MTKVSFVGAGYMTSEHLKVFAEISGVKLEGIYSRTRSKSEALAQRFDLSAVCDSISDLYQRTKADLLVISVPELAVREVCLEAFKYPWTCLIEKPAGYNYEDAETIVSAAKKSNSKAYVALNRRHYSATINVLSDLSTINQTRLIHVYDQENPKAALAAGQPELVVENWMYANSIHMIDYLSFLGRGKIVNVENIIPWDPQKPEFVMSKISYDSGDIGIYEAVWNAPGPWSVVITTQEKRWEMRPLEQAFVQNYGSRKQEPVSISEWDTKFKPGLRVQAEEAIKAVSGKLHNLPTLDDALESMKLVKTIYFGG
jgi:predicted dehydrogenase